MGETMKGFTSGTELAVSVQEEYSLEAGDATRCGREAKSGTDLVSDSNRKREAGVEGTGE